MIRARVPSVYFIARPADARIKIGVSCDPERRRQELRLQSGVDGELALLAAVPHVDAYGLERRLHYDLAAHRLVGEWFADCAEVRAAMAAFVAAPRSLYDAGELSDADLCTQESR